MLAPTTFLSTLLIFFTSVQAAQRSFNLVHLKSEHDPLSRFKPNSAHLSPLSQVTVDHHSSNLPQSQAIQDGLPVRDPLVNFEVNVPPRIFSKEEGMESCTITLVERSFTNYSPSVLTYSPSKLLPTKCQDPEKWSHLVLSQYGTSRGRQFDRLGTVFLNGLEAWRTDNAEPVNTTGGVIWTTEKQIDQYYDFFSKDGTLLFDYPNVVDDTYTGALNVTLSLTTYLTSEKKHSKDTPLHLNSPLLFPLSKLSLNSSSLFAVGGDNGDSGVTQVTIPKNAESALVEIFASGTATDEFWYTNIPDSIYNQIVNASSQGYYPRGPFREIQLLIDDQLAGVALPFPVIFTGGINPLLHRPESSFGAYNQPNYYIDITPFVGTLTDEKAHSFKLQVSSAEKNHTIDASWFISGNVQVILDSSNERTTGEIIAHIGPDYGSFSTIGTSDKFAVKTKKPRTLRIEGTVKTGSSKRAKKVVWEQSHEYSNSQAISETGQTVDQSASGTYKSRHDGKEFFSSQFSFPLSVDLESDSTTLNATVDHAHHQTFKFSEPRFSQPKTQLISTHQTGQALSKINSQGQIASGVGTTSQKYSYKDSNGYDFGRETKVSNNTIVSDRVTGNLKEYAAPISYSDIEAGVSVPKHQNKRRALKSDLSLKRQTHKKSHFVK